MNKSFNKKIKELRKNIVPEKVVFEKKIGELRKNISKIPKKKKQYDKHIKAIKKIKTTNQKDIRSKTGISGLDESLNGGIPKGNFVIVAGGPGSGKTTLGFQYLYEGAKKFGEPGVFISLEEEPERIIENYEKMGFKVKPLIKNKKLLIVKNTLYKMDALMQNITDSIELINAKRIVIDPGSLISLFFETKIEVRKALIDMANLLKRLKITSIITSDFNLESENTFSLEEYAADGVILLYHVKTGNVYERMLAILKMRGTTHTERIMPFHIEKGGITIYSEEEVFTEV